MAALNIKVNLSNLENILRDAVTKNLSTQVVRSEVNREAKLEIEKAVRDNQNSFRPDAGPDGGDDLVGLLGIGQGGRPLVQKYAGPDAAWRLLNPGTAVSKFTSSFRKARVGKFATISYEIDLDKFFNNFRSTYVSRKRGDSDFVISWMQSLIDGIPTEQIREYPDGENQFVFVTGGPNFNPKFSRTGLGHMVPAGRLQIPAQQFSFRGRGRANTFGKLLSNIEKNLGSSRFKRKVEKVIAISINKGG